jgi:hypothetical protein
MIMKISKIGSVVFILIVVIWAICTAKLWLDYNQLGQAYETLKEKTAPLEHQTPHGMKNGVLHSGQMKK